MFALTNFTVLPGPSRWALANVAALRQYVASSAVLARLADARIQRLLTISAGELRGTDALVVGLLVLLHGVILVRIIIVIIIIIVVLQIVLQLAILAGAVLSGVALHLLH